MFILTKLRPNRPFPPTKRIPMCKSPLYFQQLTHCSFAKPFVLISMRTAPGGGGRDGKMLTSRPPRLGRRQHSLTLEPFHSFTSERSKRLSSAKLSHLVSITSTIAICKSFCLIWIRTHPGG